MNILVSACLLGAFCRFDGQLIEDARVTALSKEHTLIPVCPEIYGGLPTPRLPGEKRDGRVYDKSGADVTEPYARGAEAALVGLNDRYEPMWVVLGEQFVAGGE